MARLRARRAAGEAGFTLIELLIVIVILGILAGIAIFALSAFRSDASGAGYDSDRRNLETAIAGYYGRNSVYPSDLQDLVAGGYLDNASISADQLHLVGNGYTIEFTPGSPPTLSDRSTSLAAGGTPVDPGGGGGGGGASASPSPSPASSPSPAAVATTMTAAVTAAQGVKTCCANGSASNFTWTVAMSVKVIDNLGADVSAANVTGVWSFTPTGTNKNGTTGTATTTCSTLGNGACSVSSATFEANVTDATFTVTSVSKSGLTWSHPAAPADTAVRPF